MNQKDIKPGIGLGNIKFGMTRNEIKKMLGEPNETEQFSYTDSDEDITESWHYDELELSIGFDEDVDWKLMTLAVSSEDYEFMGKKLIGLNHDELLKTLDTIGIKELETEDCSEEENENCFFVISEENGISFWLEDGSVTEIQWGPEYIDEDTVRWPD